MKMCDVCTLFLPYIFNSLAKSSRKNYSTLFASRAYNLYEIRKLQVFYNLMAKNHKQNGKDLVNILKEESQTRCSIG